MALATKYAMDMEEVGIGDDSPDLKLNMRCPQLGNGPANNWSIEQCLLRVRVNNPCTVTCKFGRDLKAQLDATGEDYLLEPFPGLAVGQKTKKKSRRVKNFNDRWPGRNKERDVNMAREMLNGTSFAELSEKYLVCQTNIRRIVYKCLRIANPSVYEACPEHMNQAVFAKLNKSVLLPHLVFHKEEGQTLKGV